MVKAQVYDRKIDLVYEFNDKCDNFQIMEIPSCVTLLPYWYEILRLVCVGVITMIIVQDFFL